MRAVIAIGAVLVLLTGAGLWRQHIYDTDGFTVLALVQGAFYLAAVAAKGNAWTTVGPIWYQVMQNLLPHSNFKDCAKQLRQVSIAWAKGKYAKVVDKALIAVGL